MNPTDNAVPTHVGIIMDGNRRWAKANGLEPNEGHSQGLENLRTIVKHAITAGIPYLSVFVFSTENWSRTKDEVGYLMSLVNMAMSKYLDEFHAQGAKVVVVGSEDNVPKNVLKTLKSAKLKTAGNTRGILALCFNYGGHREIIDAVKSIVKNGVKSEDVTSELIAQNLYQPDLPSIDLIIRTSGEQRTSGFMLWRSAYSELYFTDKHWPDFTPKDFDAALKEYAGRQRRFGK
jgi:undecaprenyl diphosphate synthase